VVRARSGFSFPRRSTRLIGLGLYSTHNNLPLS
jgi:hypothetical protein